MSFLVIERVSFNLVRSPFDLCPGRVTNSLLWLPKPNGLSFESEHCPLLLGNAESEGISPLREPQISDIRGLLPVANTVVYTAGDTQATDTTAHRPRSQCNPATSERVESELTDV